MRKFNNKFKKFGGEYIPDVVQYLKSYIEMEPSVTISVGCDSVQKSKKTLFAITIMLYNKDIRRGAHVIFFRESHSKIKDDIERLSKEAEYLYEIGTYLNDELSKFYVRKDLSDFERKRYKYHVAKCNGDFSYVPHYQEELVIKNLELSDSDLVEYKLVDIHVDFNPFETNVNNKGVVKKNKSFNVYKIYVPWLRSLGFRTWAKPLSYASACAADLLLQN